MSTKSAVSSAVAPWHTELRAELLDQFLAADLLHGGHVGWLRTLLGTGATGSREYGQWVGDPNEDDVSLGRDYDRIQKFFKRLIERRAEAWGTTRSGPRDREQVRETRRRLGRGLNQLVEMLADVRLDFARETYEGGPAEHADFRELLIKFGRTSVRSWPLRLEWTSESLIGELALALAERLSNARRSGRCPICGEIWLAEDGRGNRRLCGKDICATAWRQRRRKPEQPGSSTARVRKHRGGKSPKRRPSSA